MQLPMVRRDFDLIPDRAGVVYDVVDTEISWADEDAGAAARKQHREEGEKLLKGTQKLEKKMQNVSAVDRAKMEDQASKNLETIDIPGEPEDAELGASEENVADPMDRAQFVDSRLLQSYLQTGRGSELKRGAVVVGVNDEKGKFGGAPLTAALFDFNQFFPQGALLTGISSKWWADNHPAHPIKKLDPELNGKLEAQIKDGEILENEDQKINKATTEKSPKEQDREQIKGIVASIRSKLPFGKKKEEDTMDAASMEGEGAEVASQNQQARQLDEDRFVSLVPQFVEKAMEAVNHRIFQSGMAMDGDMKIHKSAVPENTQRVSV